MSVTRCVCYRRSFASLKLEAAEHGWTSLDQLRRCTSCGNGCGSCQPYLAAMLETGATSFAVWSGIGPPRPAPRDPWDPID